MATNKRPIKITTVGDGLVGKTCLLIKYTQNAFPPKYVSTVFDKNNCNITVDGMNYNMVLWDTAGQDEYDRIRSLCYPDTNCFLLCYSIASRISFENAFSKWFPEIRHFSPNVPIILVGTKSDLCIPNSEAFVTSLEGETLKENIHSYAYVECSAKLNQNLQNVFDEAIRAVKNDW